MEDLPFEPPLRRSQCAETAVNASACFKPPLPFRFRERTYMILLIVTKEIVIPPPFSPKVSERLPKNMKQKIKSEKYICPKFLDHDNSSITFFEAVYAEARTEPSP